MGMMANMPDTDVTITLTNDEALVLFELLHRWEDQERVGSPQNEAELVALWNLSGLLERELRAPFDPRYADLLAEATARLTPSE
ncbi:hypothetical protein [Nocardioides sp. NPDC004968]|uniref:hypothetical protein n=1 Tax=Nocardioides sp. NPDC004968 TaxID=3155894 RepID=UPI0033A18FFB